MLVVRSLVGVFFACSLGLCACSGSSDALVPPTSSPSATTPSPSKEAAAEDLGPDSGPASAKIARLIPITTAIYVQCQSFKRFDAVLGRLSRANENFARQFDELGRELHRLVPGDQRQIHQDRPVGLAITLPADRDPEFTFVLPIKDIASYKRSLQLPANLPQPVFDGNYLAVTNSPHYERPREPVAVAADIPDQALTAHIDLARIDHRYGSQIRLALEALAAGTPLPALEAAHLGPLLSSKFQQVADPLLFALAVGRQANLSIEVEADRIDVRCSLETRDAGVLAGWTASGPIDLTPFARSLVASDSLAALAGCDRSVLASRLAPLLTSTQSQSELLAGMLETFADQFGPLGAVTGTLSPGQTRFALHLRGENRDDFAAELASTFELFSRRTLGIAVQSKNAVVLEGVEVEDLLVHLDASSMCALSGESSKDLAAVQTRLDGFAHNLFGADHVRVRIAGFGERAVIAIGNDEAWFRRTLLWAKQDKDLTPPDVRSALEYLGETPAAVILRMDLARRYQDDAGWNPQWNALFEPVRLLGNLGADTLQALDPIPLTIALGASGRTLRISVSGVLPSDLSPEMVRR